MNKVINFADFVLMANNFGQSDTGWGEGNFNLDSVTNFTDFVELANHFGMTFPSTQVPEPDVMAMLCVGVLAALHRRDSNQNFRLAGRS